MPPLETVLVLMEWRSPDMLEHVSMVLVLVPHRNSPIILWMGLGLLVTQQAWSEALGPLHSMGSPKEWPGPQGRLLVTVRGLILVQKCTTMQERGTESAYMPQMAT